MRPYWALLWFIYSWWPNFRNHQGVIAMYNSHSMLLLLLTKLLRCKKGYICFFIFFIFMNPLGLVPWLKWIKSTWWINLITKSSFKINKVEINIVKLDRLGKSGLDLFELDKTDLFFNLKYHRLSIFLKKILKQYCFGLM